jgi:hypothetical protein
MPELQHMADADGKGLQGWGVGATIRLDNGDVCVLSLAATSVLVRKRRSAFSSETLYWEKDRSTIFRAVLALRVLYPTIAFPGKTKDRRLVAFANAIWHCDSAQQVASALKGANAKVTDDQIREAY